MEYVYKTEPYDHQRAVFERTRDRAEIALYLEMGTGKSKITIDTAGWQHETGVIDGLLIIAPAGVHRNWVDVEIPRHLPDRIERFCVTWRSGKMESKSTKANLADLLTFDGLSVLSMNVEAIITKIGRSYVERFLARRRVLAVIDESIIIKTPGASRTKVAITLGKRARTRRICSGAPITQGPLDLYAQFQFLRPGILGFTSFLAFKHTFAEWDEGFNGRTGRTYQTLKCYRNQDQLLALCAPYTERITKDECLDLPPKVYERRPFAMTADQRSLYEKLREEYVAELSSMESVTVAHALTRILRLQQVASGYWPERHEGSICAACGGVGCESCDDLGMGVTLLPMRRLTTTNPRIDALRDLLEELPVERQVICWCRFRFDVEEVLAAFGADAVRYDGATGEDERATSIAKFMAGEARLFVGTPRAGGRGLTLTAASVVVFYSHDFSYEIRAQAEDRAHRIGQTRSVTYVDLIAEDTVDERLLEVVAAKRDLAALFDRDPRSWLTMIRANGPK